MDPITEMRAKRLTDELDQCSAHPFDVRGEPSVLGNKFAEGGPMRPLELRRVRKDPAAYRLGDSTFGGQPITYGGVDLADVGLISLAPGDRVYLQCEIRWHRSLASYPQAVFGDPPVRSCNREYKNGRYTLIRAEILILSAGAPGPTSRTEHTGMGFLNCNDNPLEHDTEIENFLLGEIDANGDVEAPVGGSNFGQPVPSGTFTITILAC